MTDQVVRKPCPRRSVGDDSTPSEILYTLAQGWLVTPEGREQIKEWLATVTDAERAKYKRSLVQQMEHPVFLIDASPLVAVYTRPAGGVQVVYFTVGGDKDLLRTNIARITDSDKLFKRGVLRDAAAVDKLFSRFAVK